METPLSPIDWALFALFGVGLASVAVGIAAIISEVSSGWPVFVLLFGGLLVGGLTGVYGWIWYRLHTI